MKRVKGKNEKLLEKLEEQATLQNEVRQVRGQLSQLIDTITEQNSIIKTLQEKNAFLEEQLKLSRRNLYGSKSQKGSRKAQTKSREEEKDDFDGNAPCESANTVEEEVAQEEATRVKEARPYRCGMSYKKMKADSSVFHRSDLSRLPEGAVRIKTCYRYSYEQISRIVEHRYEVIRYKMPDGKLYDGYFPCSNEPEIIDAVPGTHASSDFLAHLAFNHFVLDIPYYREMYRLNDEKMYLSRMTLINWLDKGAAFAKELVNALKSIALEKDSIANCDETWCRVKVNGSYLKKYIWCLVNKKAKIAIYFYEDGSRGRKVLTDFLGKAELEALQSDGYNVYCYFDNKLTDTVHLCCMAHARAKFQYAFEQSGDKEAKYILDSIGELYGLEREYKNGHLTAEQITRCRQSLRTKDIVGRIRSQLTVLLSPDHPPLGDLMGKAVNYLNKFWNQLFAYLQNGRYDIDNSIAEQSIRPLAGERKNSLFYGSHKMANVSAIYHTLISTCRMCKVSALEYLKKFFQAIVKGRRDYENLLPMTIANNI